MDFPTFVLRWFLMVVMEFLLCQYSTTGFLMEMEHGQMQEDLFPEMKKHMISIWLMLIMMGILIMVF